jgi:hypothetical protein
MRQGNKFLGKATPSQGKGKKTRVWLEAGMRTNPTCMYPSTHGV